jgi:hypothetical protein
MSDIANELRERSLRAEQEGEPLALLDDAADEIERLRLTDAEREAIGVAVVDMANAITVNTPVPVANGIRRRAAELWGLLERTK